MNTFIQLIVNLHATKTIRKLMELGLFITPNCTQNAQLRTIHMEVTKSFISSHGQNRISHGTLFTDFT